MPESGFESRCSPALSMGSKHSGLNTLRLLPGGTLSVGSTLAQAIQCPRIIRNGKGPWLLTGSLGSTTKAFAAGFSSKSKSSPTPDLYASLEFLDLASEYSLPEQVSNLWFPSNGSVLHYRTWLVCTSIMRQGTSLTLNYTGDLKLFWLSPVVRSPAPNPQEQEGQKIQPHYQKDKTKQICYDGGVLCVLLVA